MSIIEIVEEAAEQISQLVSKLPRVNASRIGLDTRAGTVYVDTNDRLIIVRGRTNSLDYYGGFEYVDADSKFSIGDYTVYTDGDGRVSEAIDFYEDNIDC
jgi:hypothetical protein